MSGTRSLGSLVLAYEMALLFLFVLSGALGALSYSFWRQGAHDSARVNRLLLLNEQARGTLSRQLQFLVRARLLEDPGALENYAALDRRLDELLNEMRRNAGSRPQDEAVQALQQQYSLAQKDMNQVFSDPYVAQSRIRMLNPGFAASMAADFDALHRRFRLLLHEERERLSRELGRRIAVAAALFPVLLAAGVALVWFTRRTLVRDFMRPMRRLTQDAGRVSGGDLEHRLRVEGVREVARLARALNYMSEELARSRDAQIRNERQAALGALVPVVAHNIRNPLASLRATAQVLEDSDDKEDRQESCRAILATIDRLGRWVSALVSYLHPLQPRLVACRAVDLLDTPLKMLDDRLAGKRLRLRREPWDRELRLRADPDLMEQALYGLLANAVDASPEGGELAVGVEHVGQADARQALLWIEDQGPGLPFDPAPADLSPGPSSKRFGTGLGIPVAFKICQSHGWELSFARGPRGGAQVRILAPAAGAAA